MQICLLCPWDLILFSAWSFPSLRLGLLIATQLWMRLLLFHLRLRLLSFWLYSTLWCIPLMFPRVAVRRL
jgi:hypothetical protein